MNKLHRKHKNIKIYVKEILKYLGKHFTISKFAIVFFVF